MRTLCCSVSRSAPPPFAGRVGVGFGRSGPLVEAWTWISFSVKMASMSRKKTTVYIDEALLRAAKVAAARSGKREYEVFEDALRRHLGFAGTVERIWAGITPEQAPSEEEAARLAAEELASVRAERSPRRAG